MRVIELAGKERAGLLVAVAEDSRGVTMRLCGSADSRSKDELRALLLETHDTVQKKRISKVFMDLRELEFMNSACFKALVFWLVVLRGLAADQQYQIVFLCDPAVHWQRRSLRALSCFAAGLIHIEH